MTAKEQGLPQNVTEDQRRAIQSFVHSAIVPLIEDVIVKKLGQAAIVLRDELSGAALASDTGERGVGVNPEIIGNPDAAAWADCFAKAHPKSTIGWDVMVGWFANAMMAAHDHALAKPVKITPDILAAVAGYYHDGPVRNWDVVRAIESSIAALRAQPAGGGFPHAGLPADFPPEILEAAKKGTPDYWLGYLAGREVSPPESGGQGESVTVRRNDDGSLDEVVGSGEFHLEQMDGGHWYLALGPHMLSLHSKKVIKAEIELNAFAQGGGNER